MSVAKVTEITSNSPTSFDDAIESGLRRANKTIKHIRNAWIRDHEVCLDESGKIIEYRVKMKVTFVLND